MINLENLTKELNPAQKKAVENPINFCTKIVAGAGTGKTKIISKRFVKLVLDLKQANISTPTSKILVITFTDKAANEMKERITKELTANNLNSYGDELWISTFHGFCNKILRKHAIEANLSPSFELAEDKTLENIYNKIFKTIRYDEYQKIENIEQISSDLGLESNLLNIINIKELMAIDDLESVFSSIFNTIKKIKTLGLTPKEFLEKTISATINFSETLKTLPFGFKEPLQYAINWHNHLKKYVDSDCNFDDVIFKAIADEKSILCKNGSSKAENWTPATAFPENIIKCTELEVYLTKVIALIYAIYQAELEKQNLVDFDDLINKTIYIFKNNQAIKSYYQDYFKHLIIDEFQDTNGAQLELIKLLLNPKEPNITFVGDRKQSIYGFRHAQMENLEVLHHYIEKTYDQKYPEIKLETNYRSSEHVLNAVNYVTTKHLQLNEKLFPSENHKATSENTTVFNTVITNNIDKYYTELKEATYIAHKICELKEQNNLKFKDFAVLVKTHEQTELIESLLALAGVPAVKKSNQSFFKNPVVKNALAVIKMLKNPLDEIALTRLLQVDLSHFEIYQIKKEIDNRIKEQNLFEAGKRVGFCEKITTLYNLGCLNSAKLKNLYDLISKLIAEKRQKSILQLFTGFAQNYNLFSANNEIEQFQAEFNLKIFEKIISEFEQNKDYTNISNFLDYFDRISTDKNFELPAINTEEIDAVQILTIHASKGLEFPYVFVFGTKKFGLKKSDDKFVFDLQYGTKPGFGLIIKGLREDNSPKNELYKLVWAKPRGESEAIRLFYVAVSRAEKYLNILTYEKTRGNIPAEYTCDYPNSVIKEEINADNIDFPEFSPTAMPQDADNSTALSCLEKTAPTSKSVYHFSFSKLNTFNACEKRFLLKYKFGYPSVESSNTATQTGSIIHKLIYNSFLYKRTLQTSELSAFLTPLNLNAEDTEKILNLYTAFANSQYSVEKLAGQTVFAERAFEFSCPIGEKEVIFVGDIDLLIENSDKTYTIVDFKTNENLDKSQAEYQKQLYLYKKALETEGLTVKSALLVGLKTNGEIQQIFLTENSELQTEFETTIKDAIRALESDAPPRENPDACRFCEYKYICG